MPFDGDTYDRAKDYRRLDTQMGRVYRFVCDGAWYTLDEIKAVCGGTDSSISARLRDFRKEKFGSYTMESRRKTGAPPGTWEYRVLVPEAQPKPGQQEMFA